MGGQVLLTVALIKSWPKFSKKVPASLVAIVVCSVVEQLVRLATGGVGSYMLGETTPVGGGIPGLPLAGEWTLADVQSILPAAISYATVAIVEELLTMRVVDEVLERETGESEVRRQLAVGSLASIVAGAAGTMGGSTNVALSMVLLHSGDPGVSRVGPLVTAALVALAAFVAGPAIGYVPVGTLVGIMLIVIGHTFNWSTPLLVLAAVLPRRARNALHLHRKVRRADALVIAAVTVLTLVANLAIAVAVGMVVSVVLFAWQSSLRLSVVSDCVRTRPRKNGEKVRAVKVYHVSGPIYYGTVSRLTEHFGFSKDPDDVEVHFREAEVHDFSGLQALMVIGERYHALGKRCTLRHLSVDATQLIARTRHWSLQPAAYDIHEHLEEGEVPLERAFHLTISEAYDEPL
jgi:SulP family sulfate permease